MSRTASWATCDNCMASIVIYPHPDSAKDLPPEGKWEWWSECPVCGDDIDIEGSDPAHELIKNYPNPKEAPNAHTN